MRTPGEITEAVGKLGNAIADLTADERQDLLALLRFDRREAHDAAERVKKPHDPLGLTHELVVAHTLDAVYQLVRYKLDE